MDKYQMKNAAPIGRNGTTPIQYAKLGTVR